MFFVFCRVFYVFFFALLILEYVGIVFWTMYTCSSKLIWHCIQYPFFCCFVHTIVVVHFIFIFILFWTSSHWIHWYILYSCSSALFFYDMHLLFSFFLPHCFAASGMVFILIMVLSHVFFRTVFNMDFFFMLDSFQATILCFSDYAILKFFVMCRLHLRSTLKNTLLIV